MSLKRNLAANYLGQTWVALMGLAFLPVYIDYLGAEGLGLIGVFAVLQACLVLLDLGITPTLTREMARFTAGGHTVQSIHNLLRSLEAVVLVAGLGIAGGLWAASGYLARDWLKTALLGVDVVRQSVALMGFLVALRLWEGMYRGALLGLQRHVFFNLVNAAMATGRYIGAIGVLAFVSPTITAFYLWQIVVSVVAVVIMSVAVHRTLPAPTVRAQVSWNAFRSVQRFAGGMLIIAILSLLVSQVDKVLLSKLLPLEEFGHYTLAATMAGILSITVVPVLQSVYPRLVELSTHGSQAALAAAYHNGAQLVSVVTIPSMLVLTLFPSELVYVWSGDVELAALTAPLLMPLALGAYLNALMWMPYHSQLAHGWTSLTIRVNAVAVAVVVPAILWLVPWYGARAAAWIWVAVNAAYVLITVPLMHRRILVGEKSKWYLQDVLAPAFGAAAVGLLLSGLTSAPTDSRILGAAWLAVAGAMMAVVALLCAGNLAPRAFRLLRSVAD